MKKIALSLLTVATLSYSHLIFSAPMSNWSGFYLGANVGYWGAHNNDITTTGSVNYINPDYDIGSSNVANALVQIATNNASIHPHGFIGGGQAGYNYETNIGILMGLSINLDGLTSSNNTYNLQKTVSLVDFDENYAGTLAIKQRINYLGTVDARIGYLFYPNLLAYFSGGFAYANVTLNTAWNAQESLGPLVFPAIDVQSNRDKTLTGWTLGGGLEWLFKPNWSAMLEYAYYSLNNVSASATLAQTNTSLTPAALWASASANTALSLSVWDIRVGINYHFC